MLQNEFLRTAGGTQRSSPGFAFHRNLCRKTEALHQLYQWTAKSLVFGWRPSWKSCGITFHIFGSKTTGVCLKKRPVVSFYVKLQVDKQVQPPGSLVLLSVIEPSFVLRLQQFFNSFVFKLEEQLYELLGFGFQIFLDGRGRQPNVRHW